MTRLRLPGLALALMWVQMAHRVQMLHPPQMLHQGVQMAHQGVQMLHL